MKNLTRLLFIVVLTFTFVFNVNAAKEIKVSAMISPLGGSQIAAGFPTLYTFIIENSGDVVIGATDSIIVAWGQMVGTQITLQSPFTLLNNHKVLNPGDTMKFGFSLTLNGTTAGTFKLVFVANHTNNIQTFKGVIITYQLNVGMEDMAKPISKVWYNQGNINLVLNPKATCQADLIITNINGQLVESKVLNLVSENNLNESFYVGYLPTGIYVVSIKTPFGTDVRKIMIR